MEGNGRRLGWIAIALSALALFVAVRGQAQSRWQGYYGPQAYGPPAWSAPQQVGPGAQAWPGQQGAPGEQGNVGPQNRFGPRQEARPDRGGRWQPPFAGRRHFGPGMFFLFPLILIGGLVKLALVALLVWFGLKLLRGRRGPSGPDQSGPNRPGPEQPPYTGETQQM